MRLELTLTPTARNDLFEIADSLSEYSERVAVRLTNQLERRIQLLCTIPKLGRLREDLLTGMRSVVVDKCVIYYIPTESEIQIIRVLHGARNVHQAMFVFSPSDPPN